MKRPLITLLVLSLLLPASTLAAEVFSGQLQDDLFFPDGVKVLGVSQPPEDQEVGISSVFIDGYGSMIIGSRSTGDFPRMAIVGGTTVMSKRDWTNHQRKTWWNGTIQSPQPKKLITLREVPELHPVLDRGIRLEVVGTYQWGLDNERFDYSIPARVALPAEARDDEKVFMVFQDDNNVWKVDRNRLCTVQNKLCVFDIQSIKSLTLVKRAYEVAQAGGGDDGFWESLFNNGGNSDNPDDFFDDLFNGAESENPAPQAAPPVSNVQAPVAAPPQAGEAFVPTQPQMEGGMDYKQYYEAATYQGVPREDQRHYYLKKYGTNSDDRANTRPEEGLSAEEIEKVRAVNVGKISRKLRKEPEVAQYQEDTSNSRILDYLLAMRNKFGEGSQANIFGQQVELESAPEEAYTGFLLPSSGPGFFVAIAILGFMLMVFGALRRQ